MPHEDFDVDSLAAYLHMVPAQIAKLADRGNLPGRKVGGQWRFSQAEIHHWLEERIGLADDEGLAQMETVLERAAPQESDAISLAELLPIEGIAVPLDARTRSRVISAMAELAAGTGLLWDPKALEEAVRAREAMQPTAQENGVALLHPRRPMPSNLGQAFIALGITATGIPFGGSGGRLTDIFFLINSVNDPGHLRTLARVSRLVTDADLLDALRQAGSASEVHDLLLQRDREYE